MTLASNAIAFTLLGDGIPIIYSGQEHHLGGPDDRQATWLSAYDTSAPLAQLITTLNKLRKQAISATGSNYTMDLGRVIYSDDHTMTMRKGASSSQIVAVYTNLGSLAAPFSLDLMTEGTGFAANEAVMEILTCAVGTVYTNGTLSATITQGQPLVYFPVSALAGSGLCASSTSDALHSNSRRSGLVALSAVFPILWLSELFG
jgi:alpha-amylase